jgi:hypothetical protein
MSNKILIAVAPAILLASTGLASAKTQTHWRAPYAYDYYAPCATIDSVTGTCRISNDSYDRPAHEGIRSHISIEPNGAR